jgi:serine/threonine protein kinase
MPKPEPLTVDTSLSPFDRYRHVRWLAPERRGHESQAHTRHQLFIARDKNNPVDVLIKVTSKPGLVYEHDLDNEWASLSTINRELPESPYFPFVHDRGRLKDGRRYLITSLFDEFPLATVIGSDHASEKLVRNVRIGIEIARALSEIHRLDIFHVDLNPMNVLYRTGTDRPVIRIVDFESSYERKRHSAGEFFNPPMTAGYSAPEASRKAPDARTDVFSLGAVLYTLVAGYRWGVDLRTRLSGDEALDADLRHALLKATDPVPRRRFGNVDEFQAALGAYLERIWPGRSW